MNTRLLVATSKGLVIYHSAGHGWDISSIEFQGLPVSLVYVDERTNRWWAALSHRHWGEKLHFSDDEGKGWKEVDVPGYEGRFYRPGVPVSLKKLWVMQHGGHDRPGEIWLGTEPGGLFHSKDHGNSFHLVEGLWNHPTRLDENLWFGAGKDYPFIHSIVLDPRNSDHLFIGISCAGVFETWDAGTTWAVKNKGLVAAYLPNPKAEVGHDPHRILQCRNQPDVLWQQNHCGIFRTTNGGDRWEDVSSKDGFPRYGFALAIDEYDPNVAFVIPAQSDEQRIPVDLKLTVCKTTDGGASWQSINHGLPDSAAFDLVLRHSFSRKGDILAFGTNNGNVYVSENTGASWKGISQNLATVNGLMLL